MVYSIAERVEIVAIYYRNHDCAKATARIFNANHPEKNVNHQYVKHLIDKFVATGSLLNKKREVIGPVRNEAVEVAVLGHVQMDNKQSITTVSQASGVSRSSVHRILKKHKFHPFKMTLVQELHEDDFDRRNQFCEYFSEQLLLNPNLLYNTCFSDECTFMLNGEVNRHNCRYWSDTNPHLIREFHTQTPQKLNVWAGILGDHLVGPFFIQGNLDGNTYLELLESTIDPRITEILESDDNLLENEITFQQDGAPPHYAAAVRQFLDDHFPGHWIGRRGPVEWPPRSPDLSPLDFFLWGHLKSRVYATQPETLQVLRQRIVEECRLITADVFNNVRTEFENRLYYCLEVNGGHFEQFIK
jgi:hypothetical protein